MEFKEVLYQILVHGKKFTRKHPIWQGYYVGKHNNTLFVFYSETDKPSHQFKLPAHFDTEATDWYEYDPNITTISQLKPGDKFTFLQQTAIFLVINNKLEPVYKYNYIKIEESESRYQHSLFEVFGTNDPDLEVKKVICKKVI